jgi:hypothetical protein
MGQDAAASFFNLPKRFCLRVCKTILFRIMGFANWQIPLNNCKDWGYERFDKKGVTV